MWQVIMPKAVRQQFIRQVHTQAAGHLGRNKTQAHVARRAYWPGWTEDVDREVRKCPECAKYHRGAAPRQLPLRPFHSGEPFEVVSIDITGPHPRSKQGNEYIVTIVDLMSKWAEAVAVRNHTAPVVARIIMENIVAKFGTPLRIVSDQGSEFQSGLFTELCKRLQIDKVRTSPYQPSTNGCVERFHRTLNSMLAKVINQNQRDWDEHLSAVMMAYRASVHESTGFSPNFIVFGRETRAPLDVVFGTPIEDQDHSRQQATYDDFVEHQRDVYEDAFRLVRQHLGKAANQRKERYDVRVRQKQFHQGQWVYYFKPRRYQGKSPKWLNMYTGPYLIVKEIPPHNYVIQLSKKSAPQVVHGNKLKICLSPTGESWLKQSSAEGGQDAAQTQHAEEQESQPVRQQLEEVRRQSETSQEKCAPSSSCLLYTSPSPRDGLLSRMPSSA